MKTTRNVIFKGNAAVLCRQLLGDKTVDPFYWASGELPLDPRATEFQEAA